jgi:uncharacterized protein
MTFLIGFIVAVAVGLTGVGAGSITAPVLILMFGTSPADAVGTSLVYSAVIKLAVAPVYFWRKQVSLRILGLLCAGGVPGVLAGVYLIDALDGKRYESFLLMLVGATVAFMALFSLYRTLGRNAPTVGTDRPAWLSLIGGGLHLSAGHYNGTILWQLLTGGLVGVFVGANLSKVLPARPLRIALSLCLSGLGMQLWWKGFAFAG